MLIALGLPLAACSQDTTCLPNSQLKKALQLIEQGKVDRVELSQVKQQNESLLQLLHVKDQQLTNWMQQGTAYKNQVVLKDEALASLQKALKKQKTKTILASVSGIAAAVALTFLFHH